MAEENIMLFENDDKSYTVVDSYITSNRYLEYIDSYNYYDIDADKILLFNILSTPKIQIKKKYIFRNLKS